jgi:hypothetical protein
MADGVAVSYELSLHTDAHEASPADAKRWRIQVRCAISMCGIIIGVA